MTLFGRVMRGLREQLRTQLLSVATVSLALFCLAGAVLAVENAGALAARWGAPVKMTVYLADGAGAQSVEALRQALAEMPEVQEARYVSPHEARMVLAQTEGPGVIDGAPADLFPSTIELELTPAAVDPARLDALRDRVRRLNTVTDVETYQGFTDRLHSLLATGRAAAGAVALGVLLCALLVVSNTVRLSLHARMREVEVLRFVGASPAYVRTPFVFEGAFLGGLGAAGALAALALLFYTLRPHVESTLGEVLGMHPTFLSWWAALLFLAGGCVVGAAGSAFALRRGASAAGA